MNHDLNVMSSKPDRVELGVSSTFVQVILDPPPPPQKKREKKDTVVRKCVDDLP